MNDTAGYVAGIYAVCTALTFCLAWVEYRERLYGERPSRRKARRRLAARVALLAPAWPAVWAWLLGRGLRELWRAAK